MATTIAPARRTGLDALAGASGDPLRLLVAAWLAGYKSPRTRAAYATGVRQWLAWCADHDVDPLTAVRAHVELWQRHLEEQGRAVKTVSCRVGAVASWYGYLLDEEVVPRDPTARVRRPKVERRSTTAWLTRPQLADLIAAAAELGPHPHALISILVFNGLRIAEACSLDIASLAWEGTYPVLTFTRKGGKSGRAVLSRPTEAAVLAAANGRGDGPLLLTHAGTRMNQKAAQRIIDRCMRQVRGNHGRITPHALRHSWATAAVAAHVPPDQLQHDGGWSDARMVAYYSHGQDVPDRAATHAVTAFISGAR